MGLKIVTGRTGTPHVSSNQMQAFNRAFLGDFALFDIGQHLDAVVRDSNTVRIYDGCIVIQGVYAIIPYDEFEDILVEPVSVGNTRIDTIYLHYAKDMETDTETVELDIAQGEEAVNNPVKPDIDLGGDIWEGETDIRVPLYDVTITSFDMTLTAYEYMNTYLPDISELSEKIPENIVSGVKGNAEATFRKGNVNLTASNIGINANPTGTATDVLTTIEIDGVVYSIAGGSESDIPMIAEAIKQWDTGTYTIDLYGIGLPDTYYPASSTYSENRYLDVNTGIMYDCEQTGASTYTWHQAPVNLRLKTDINASDIEDIQEDISQSLTATGNPITIEAAEANAVECTAGVEAVQDLHGYDHPWVGGAGKNKLPMTVEGIKSANTSGTWSGNVYSKNNGTFEILTDSDDNVIGIKVNGTVNANTAFNLLTSTYATLTSIGLISGTSYIVNGCPQGGSFSNTYSLLFNAGNTSNKYDQGSGLNITVNSTDTYMIQVYIKSGYNATNLIFYPMIRLATETDPTFEPYENKSPITGQTEVVIKDCGKNLFGGIKFANALHAKSDYGTIDTTNKTVSFNRTSNHSPIFEYPFKENTQYTFIYSGNTESANQKNTSILFEYTDGTESAAVNLSSNIKGTYAIQSTSGKTIKSIDLRWANGANAVLYYDECGLFEGVLTTTDFEPYAGKTYRVEIGQKNKLPMTVEGIKSANTSGTWNGNVYTYRGITYTLITDSNNCITDIKATGTASGGNSVLNLNDITSDGLDNCILNGCPSGGNTSSTYRLVATGYNSGGTAVNYYNDTGSGVALALANDNVASINVSIGVYNGYAIPSAGISFKPMLRTAIDDSEFAPYNPNLPDAIYGSELDVIKGELVVDKGYKEFNGGSGENWALSFVSNSYYQASLQFNLMENSMGIISNAFETISTSDRGLKNGIVEFTDKQMRVALLGDFGITSAEQWKTWLSSNPLQVVYELATPYTIQLTPQQIRLLKGTNNISCNTGDLSIKYYPDNVLGQLKGDIEDEIDAVANRIKGVKTMQISGAAVSTDGSIMFTSLIGSLIVGTSISNDANGDKCVGIPYSMGTVPALKIMNESTMSVLSNIHISGILYYIEL